MTGLEELPGGASLVAFAAEGVAAGVPMDLRPLTPRYQVIKEEPDIGYFVYVFTTTYVWDHIAGCRRTERSAHRLGRRAVRKALKRTPEQARALSQKGRRQYEPVPMPLDRVGREAMRYRMGNYLCTQYTMECGGEVDQYVNYELVARRVTLHTSDPDGCRDDGNHCLCECHDRATDE